MSNQTATAHRVTLLESIEAIHNQIKSCRRFHELTGADNDLTRWRVWGVLLHCGMRVMQAEIAAAELEAWGDGP